MTDLSRDRNLIRLDNLFRERVNEDNAQFNLDSIFIPNFVHTLKPKYCLVAMEPSLAGKTPEEFQGWINRGFHNFIYSEGDFILQYCAYKYLCNESFDYHITDISKGAMNTKIAGRQRNIRYSAWLKVFRHEIEFFGTPDLIGVGRAASEFLHKNELKTVLSVMHYSQNNCVRFRDYYLQHSMQRMPANIHLQIKDFAENLLNQIITDKKLKEFILSRIFRNEFSDWKKGLFLHYRNVFPSIDKH